MADLGGARIALLESRMSGELANLVRRNNGEPYSVPAVRETDVESGPEVSALIDRIIAGECQVAIFLTGVGARRLFESAERLGRQSELLDALRKAIIVCRGPKPVAVLRKMEVPITLAAPEPHTTTELLATLDQVDLRDKGVLLQHYGERNAPLSDALKSRGARLMELTLYEWELPEDLEPLKELVRELIGGAVDAIAFTSQVQIRHLMKVATDDSLDDDLVRALNERTIVASVGPTCTSVLQEFGVEPRVVPEHPKMGPMILALGEYMQSRVSDA